jgi:hypothetical protein
MPKPPPRIRIALRGWIGFVEGATLDWLDHKDLQQSELVACLVETLVNILAAAGRRR